MSREIDYEARIKAARETTKDLPKLTGTTAQKHWATVIRAEVRAKHPYYLPLFQITSSAWWINEGRDVENHTEIRTCRQCGKPWAPDMSRYHERTAKGCSERCRKQWKVGESIRRYAESSASD